MKQNHKHIILIFLLVGVRATLFESGNYCKAQSPNDTSININLTLEELVISADRTPVMFEQLKRSIQVISKKEIEQLPVRNIAELIGFALNTDIRSRGAYGMQADVSIRGGSFDQTLILLNGININDPQTGHHNMDIPIDLATINRIEILKGPGARVFGPNAFNGVINIITTEKTTDQIAVSTFGGQYGLYSLSASACIKLKKFSHKFQIGKSASDGFITNTDFKTFNLFYSGTAGKVNKLEYQGAFMSKAFGANSFYTPKYPDQFEITKTLFVSVKYKTNLKGLAPVIYFRRHYDEFRLFRDTAPLWYKSHNYHYTDAIGSNANIWFKTGATGKLSVGYDIRHELIRSNKLGDSLAIKIPVKGAEGEFYTLGKSRTTAGFYIEESINFKKISISAGLLTNYLSALKGKTTFYPGIDAACRIGKNIWIYSNANRTLRLPTFTDLYYNDNTSKGDPDLKPEEAITIEAGLKYYKPGITSHMAIFKRFGHNMIDWVKPQSNDLWQAMNITDINVAGIEASFKLNFDEIALKNTFVKSLTIDYSYLHADKSSDEFMSRYALDILKHKADLLIYHQLWRNINVSWAFCFQDREGGYIKYINAAPENQETPYDAFLTFDMQLNYTFKTWVIFAEATNLFNKIYIDYGNVTQAGRWIRVGFKYNTLLKHSK